MPARLEQRHGLAQEFSRLNQVLDDRPKRDGIEMSASKIRIEERLTNDFEAPTLRVVERRSGDISSGNRVISRKTCFELKQKRACRTTDIQHRARPAIASKQSQLTLKPDRRIVAVQFVL